MASPACSSPVHRAANTAARSAAARGLRSTPADLQPRTGGAGNQPLRSSAGDASAPRTESGGNKKPPPKFTPKAFGGDKKYANPREAHRAAAKMRKDAEARLDRPRDALELYRRATALAPRTRLWRGSDWQAPPPVQGPLVGASCTKAGHAAPPEGRAALRAPRKLQSSGRHRGRRNHYGVVTKLDPDFVAGWDAWSRLELREGNPAKAAQLAKKGLAAVGALDAETPPQQSERLWHAYALALAAGRRRC